MIESAFHLRPGQGRKRTRNRGGVAERMKQDLRRLQEERDADHSALRTAVELSGHLVLGSKGKGAAGKGKAPPDDKGKGKGKDAKGKSKAKGKSQGYNAS